VQCDTPEWRGYAAYCCIWIIAYTIGFPLGLWIFLEKHKKHIQQHHTDVLDPFYMEAGFLWVSATIGCRTVPCVFPLYI
jgi:hypothetical protein